MTNLKLLKSKGNKKTYNKRLTKDQRKRLGLKYDKHIPAKGRQRDQFIYQKTPKKIKKGFGPTTSGWGAIKKNP